MAADIKAMDTDDYGDTTFSLANIGNKSGLDAGYYKGKVAIKIFPKPGKGEPNPIGPAIRNIMESWWKERTAGLVIHCLEGGKDKLKRGDKLPTEVGKMEKWWKNRSKRHISRAHKSLQGSYVTPFKDSRYD